MSVAEGVTAPMSSRPAEWAWEDMVADFRSFGGVFDNARLGEGRFGRGIFAIDPARPVTMRCPPSLFVKVRDIEFGEGGAISIRPEAEIGDAERDFFVRYMEAFNWGVARSECEAFLRDADALPEPVKAYLTNNFDLGEIFAGDVVSRARARFIKTRMISWKEFFVLFPVVDLVNHSSAASGFQILDDGITVSGQFADEVFVRYNVSDPLGVFSAWGFLSDELAAFSVRMNVQVGSLARLVIDRNLREKQLVGDFLAPRVTRDGDTATLSHLMIGNAHFPRLSKGLFYRMMKDLGLGVHAEEMFDHIHHHNRTMFFNFLALLEDYEGPTITLLRRVCRKQLEAMSFSLGVRQV